jgi:hypothetical protein
MNKFKLKVLDLLEAVEKVPFAASKVSSSQCVWKNKFFKDIDVEAAAYIVKDSNEFFSEIECDQSSSTYLSAERYGGYGVGTNGGGGRCGNVNGVQMKGVGVTPCVGVGEDLYCSSGMYPLYEAITEAVNYEIYSAVLPVGLVDIYGINYIGRSTHFVTAEENSIKQSGETKLAILVREECVRLGHFLAARNFKPLARYESDIFNDTSRTRKTSKLLRNLLGGDEQFVRLLIEFFEKSAKQFAFASIHRISHGALTASNLSLDGRWLDLTNLTFVPCGLDYRAGSANPSFLQEYKALIDIAVEFLDTYCKFNNVDINIKPLALFYIEEFKKNQSLYIAELFGLDLSIDDSNFDIYYPSLLCISECYLNIVRKNQDYISGVPKMLDLVEGDELNFIISHYRSLLNEPSSTESSKISFCYILSKSIANFEIGECCLKSYCTFLSIKALKKFVYLPFFYIGRVYLSSRAVVNDHNDFNIHIIEKYIDTYGEFSQWVFGKSDSKTSTFIFKTLKLRIVYDYQENLYLYHKDDFVSKYSSLDDVVKILIAEPEEIFNINFFCFKAHILNLMNKLKLILE